MTSITAISSAGIVTCGAQTNECRPTLDSSELAALSALVAQSGALVPSPVSYCSDCPRIYLQINRRDDKGAQHAYALRWDPTTRSAVPESIQRLFSSVATLSRLKENR